jgi:hypothetical protein
LKEKLQRADTENEQLRDENDVLKARLKIKQKEIEEMR